MAKACSHMATTAHSTAWADVYRPLCVCITEIIAASRHQRNLVKSIIRKEYIAELLAYAVNVCKGISNIQSKSSNQVSIEFFIQCRGIDAKQAMLGL